MITEADIQAVLDRLGVEAVKRIQENVVGNSQNVTGKTVKSIHEEAVGTTLSIYALEHIDTLEKGISPERSNVFTWKQIYAGLFAWYQNRGFQFTNRMVASATNKQRSSGSVLYRTGGGKNVYTGEVQPLIESIKNELGDLIINTKILE